MKLKKQIMLKKIRTFVFGERAKGEYAYKKPTFRTISGDKPSEFDWYKELNVSCLYKR
jgi:hypothetical protein